MHVESFLFKSMPLDYLLITWVTNYGYSYRFLTCILYQKNAAKDAIAILQFHMKLRVCFFKKIQDWILECKRFQKRILCFFSEQINPRSLRSWSVKGTELEVDSSVPLTHHDPKDLGLICLA